MKRLLQLIIFGCAVFIALPNVVAQNDNTSVTDTLTSDDIINLDELYDGDSATVKKERFKLFKSILDNSTYPNPNRAAAFSLLLPGAGQVYNKKYWKLPIVYGALGGIGYVAIRNQNRFEEFSEAYLAEIDDDASTINPFPFLSESALLTRRDSANKRRQEGIVFFVLTWVLNSLDAYVDAHLASFDVNEDISAHIQPTGIITPDAGGYGLSISFTPNTKDKGIPQFIY